MFWSWVFVSRKHNTPKSSDMSEAKYRFLPEPYNPDLYLHLLSSIKRNPQPNKKIPRISGIIIPGLCPAKGRCVYKYH